MLLPTPMPLELVGVKHDKSHLWFHLLWQSDVMHNDSSQRWLYIVLHSATPYLRTPRATKPLHLSWKSSITICSLRYAMLVSAGTTTVWPLWPTLSSGTVPNCHLSIMTWPPHGVPASQHWEFWELSVRTPHQAKKTSVFAFSSRTESNSTRASNA